MTNEMMLKKLLEMVDSECNVNPLLYNQLVEAIKKDIREENSKAINPNTLKLAKAILKTAVEHTGGKNGDTRNRMRYAWTKDGVQYVLDGYRIAGFFEPLDLPEWTETPDWFNLTTMLDVELNPEPLKLPTVAELKAEIKIAKANKSRCMYVLENGTGVNAQYLLDYMIGFGDSMKIYQYNNFSVKFPLWIEADDGFGLLLPINHDKTESGFYTA